MYTSFNYVPFNDKIVALISAPPLAISGFITIAVGLVIVLYAYFEAKKKNFRNHRNFMIVAALVNLSFLFQYITRVLNGQETLFPGSQFVRNFVYLPILVIHITGAIITIFLVAIHLKRSWTNQKITKQSSIYFENEYRPKHRSFGRITFYFWSSSFLGGIIIFLMLYILF